MEIAMETRIKSFFSVIPSVLITGLLLCLLFYFTELAPFGNNTLAVMDAEIQYLDFFAYFKDLLVGKAEWTYTFGKNLGGTYIGVISYYLSSPLNFMVLFFDKADLPLFFNLLVIFKLMLCSATCAIFLCVRFPGIRDVFKVLLAISYGLMQYNIAQSSNVMWLDGVYMFPLILLGVYYLIYVNRMGMLAVTVALSIIFNWYIAGINCLFSGFWCISELIYLYYSKQSSVKDLIKKFAYYVSAMCLGIALSAFLFLPTVITLTEGKGNLSSSGLNFGFLGNMISVVANLAYGSISSRGSVSLFCGGLAVLACVVYFLACENRRKPVNIAIATMALFMFYYEPLVYIFSLFRLVESYWYRYSYIGNFVIIYFAACFFSEFDIKKQSVNIVLRSAVGISGVLLLINYIHDGGNLNEIYKTVIAYLLIAFLLVLIFQTQRSGNGKKFGQIFLAGCLACVVMIDLGYNNYKLIESYKISLVKQYKKYVEKEEKLIDALKQYDSGFYRISQTSTRHMMEGNLTANYNESVAFDYNSITGYTSVPEFSQLQFMKNLGYQEHGKSMSIVNTSILSADALLGVKYILSDEAIEGLRLVEDLPEANGKSIYMNPYVLPNAFVFSGRPGRLGETGNPFVFQNELYSQLAGRNVKIFKPLSFSTEIQESNIKYIVAVPETASVLYGNLPTAINLDADLYINGQFRTAYSQWLSPSVFYIPCNTANDVNVEIALVRDGVGNLVENVYPQFYYLDLEVLGDIVNELRMKEAKNIDIMPGIVQGTVNGNDGEYLYLNIPYHSQWKIFRNGKTIVPEQLGGCLITIPLEGGINEIEAKYEVSGWKLGVAISGIALLIFIIYLKKKQKEGDNGKSWKKVIDCDASIQ